MPSVKNTLSRAAASSLVRTLQVDGYTLIQQALVPNELVSALCGLNLNEQEALVARAHYFLEVSINAPALQRQVIELETQRENYELENTFLLMGAPLRLMRRLFGMHASEFSRRRQALHVNWGNGRPPLCSEGVDHRLWQLWKDYEHMAERDRFLAVADSSGLDLHQIWASLRPVIDG